MVPRRVVGFSSGGQHGRCRLGGPNGLFLCCTFLRSLSLFSVSVRKGSIEEAEWERNLEIGEES